MGKVNRRYDRQFKEEAVRLVIDGKRPVVEVASGLLSAVGTGRWNT